MTDAPTGLSPGTARNPPAVQAALAAWTEDLAPYGIFTTDRELVIQSWNQWMVTHSGLTAARMIGRSLLEMFPDLRTRRLDEAFARALAGEVSVLSTALHKYLLPFPPPGGSALGGEHMLQTVRIAPLPVEGAVAGTVVIIEDVTQRETQAVALRRQQEHDRLLSEALALLLQSDEPLNFTADLFGLIAAPLQLDAYFNYLLSPDGRELRLQAASGVTPEVRKAFAVLPLGESLTGQAAVRRAVVVENHVQTSTLPNAAAARRFGLHSFAGFPLLLGDRLLGTLSFGSYARDVIAPDEIEVLGKIAQYVAIALDRAQRNADLRDAQRRLSAHAEDLEVKVAERTARLHETITQLESFSYTIAHDLRAPIRSLTGFTEILLSDHAQHIPEDGQALLRRLNRASHRLDALTRDLLKFSRIGRQEVRLVTIDIDELVQDILSVTPALQDGILTIQPPLGQVCAQRTLLQQCFSNLFDNALKFARPGLKPSILVRSELRATATPSLLSAESSAPFQSSLAGHAVAPGPRRRIWIEDNGIGIDPASHQKIFGIFERIVGPTPVEGTGIGLAIVARAAEQMGGSCGVESALGEGSRFWLEFAIAEKNPE